MYNLYTYNSVTYNKITETVITPPQWEVVFGGYSLKNENISLSKISYDNGHSIQSDTYDNPLTDLGGQLNYYFRQKVITLVGVLKASNREELENSIDDMKRALWRPSMNLDIKVNGVIRRAKASCVNIDRLFNREFYHLTFIPFTIEFRIVSEFSKELQRNNQNFTNLTANLTEEVTNAWTVRTNPILSILLNSTTATDITFSIWDNTLTVSDTFSASDVINIDCEAKTVSINSIDVDFSWTFPILEVWTNSYTVSINGTNDYNTNISYFNNYL